MQSAVTDFARSHPEIGILERIDISKTYPYMDKNIIFMYDPQQKVGIDVDVTNIHHTDIEDALVFILKQLRKRK